MQMRLTGEFRSRAIALASDYGYLDDRQDELLALMVDAAVEKLYGSGVPVQEGHPEYLEAVVQLAAYRYLHRAALATATGAGEEDRGYTAMVRDYVYRLRDPEVTSGAP